MIKPFRAVQYYFDLLKISWKFTKLIIKERVSFTDYVDYFKINMLALHLLEDNTTLNDENMFDNFREHATMFMALDRLINDDYYKLVTDENGNYRFTEEAEDRDKILDCFCAELKRNIWKMWI